ncbi:amino acid ABC transporter ATP-binding protein [Nocardia asteroides NBRC 15531]|uniref:ABC transporter ATP-binding protein n=1 Tax=Nocardia asteroides NBRC 15531 TaxID=1110697 RepID=U5E9C6_NOCAS|nr:ATP-binding cassette domain-containing protein [Nocardia asteroides]TLF70504.1 amino acid ABC transporter ATP-binding protein [Nocardia asteroides NBRC 15531]UGT50056.1 ATP-binding cassette domain-containing protein [Nocardia asteroides]SFN21969.1 polar amino acid transport system ATP-binding protein [Nocardia asteroides]VEG37179.1 L-cystine import ATP-binding protein TcyC [Nocardia asteroides]GAD81759.1 putative ABC transporter ATP-binding protein [Nocardia asteroides NBRC 15531]
MIRFTDVEKRFGRTVCLDHLDFAVAPGEFVTLIGPSGSGKTTALRLLTTCEQPDRGTIELAGDFLSHEYDGDALVPAGEAHLRERRRLVSVVFRRSGLFPSMSVLRNITLGPVRSLGIPKDLAYQQANRLLELVGLADRAEASRSQLSAEQQQRVAIARALAMEPKVLLLDDVTSALDPEQVTGVLHLLTDIAADTDITFLCATHDMNFARKISDRVLVFDGGRVIDSGPPEKILTDPVSTRTRQVLDAIIDGK